MKKKAAEQGAEGLNAKKEISEEVKETEMTGKGDKSKPWKDLIPEEEIEDEDSNLLQRVEEPDQPDDHTIGKIDVPGQPKKDGDGGGEPDFTKSFCNELTLPSIDSASSGRETIQQ
jgi:hypothetical protein